MICLGFDPDLHYSGWAIVDRNGPSLIACGVSKVPAKRKAVGKKKMSSEDYAVAMGMKLFEDSKDWRSYPIDRAVTEGQEIRLGGKAKPQSMIPIAHVSGAFALIVGILGVCDENFIKRPSQISKVKKRIRQARAFKALGIPASKHVSGDSEWMIPDDMMGLGKTHWKHVADAVAIAYWGATTSSEL